HALDLISETFQSGQLAGLDNRAICRKLGMSVVNFQHLFKRELKISPHRYILNRRLAYAHDLLKNSSLSIEEIAEKTGFATRYQFTRSFTRLYAAPPGFCRRKWQNRGHDR
ncbi:MAG: helix-turn-helix transcriptional regulator, partial [Lentisphaeria bacterium]|nr:helix-turn-helix transcriptional regulator [Lentisphaeria bacterium]